MPKRPNHPDYWALSEVLVSHDAEMDQGGNMEDALARFIDVESLTYAAVNQAGMLVQRTGAKLVYSRRELETAVAASFVSSFVAGMRYQTKKVQEQPLTSEYLTLTHKPGVWDGTFHVLVQALLDDLLPEGPVDVKVTFEEDGEQTATGKAVSITEDGRLILSQEPMDSAIILEHITGIEIL